jgi:hypothetical protein
MRAPGVIGRSLWSVVLGLWLGFLVVLGTTILLFFAGLIVPRVTVRTIIEGWWWTTLVLAIGFAGWCAARGRLGRVLQRSSLKGYGWSTLFAVSLIVLFYVVERWRGHQAWQAMPLESSEASLDLRSLQPSPVPATENFAATPLIEDWWREATSSADRAGLRGLLDPAPDDAAGAWELQRPANLGVCLKHYLPGAVVAAGGEEITSREFLEAWSVFDSGLDEAGLAAERPHARFELPYDRGMFDTTLGHRLKLLRAMGEALRLRAVARLANGDPDRALTDVETLIRISELVGQEPLLERQRLTLLLCAIQPVWEGMRMKSWSGTQLTALQATLSRSNLLREHRQAVHTGMLLLIDLSEKLFPVRSRVPPMDLTEELPSRLMITGARLVYPTGWQLQNQAGLHQLGQAIGNYTVSPKEHRVYVDVTRQIERDWVHHPPSLDPFFAIFIMPRGGATAADVTQRYAYAQAALDLVVTACAVERYRIARRQLPEALDELVPDWIDRGPVDVIDGRPLRYRRLDRNRYVLYSVGWNQTDDGGRVAERDRRIWSWDRLPGMRDEGDWVWRTESMD